MGDQELIKSEDACAIPKWGPSRGLRYEVDDFIVSPPSNEDGGFFHLRYGQRSKPRASTYDRINQELAMTIEVKDGDPVISEVGLSGVEKESPTLAISPTGLCPVNTAESTPDSASVQRTKPLFVLDWKNFRLGGPKEESEDPVKETPTLNLDEDIGSQTIPSVIEELKATVSESNNSQKVENSSTFAEEIIRENKVQDHFSSMKEKVEVSLVEKVHSLQVSPVAEKPFMTPFSTPISTPLTTPQTSPVVKRKIYNVVMDQGANHGYFCTKPFQGSQQNSADSSTYLSGGVGGSVGLSTTSAQMTQQLENSNKVAAALDPGQKLGKKRKPKPSTLREMNFWAPTSM
ncbi:uncharacterized protein LOC135203608 [Macrobrachium nipponense]|uniref:uncharacterized protein LOC135203608 n=1 Tax=Macrobrachium nipponense TaxID=159736 RepID=UPI0030C8207C